MTVCKDESVCCELKHNGCKVSPEASNDLTIRTCSLFLSYSLSMLNILTESFGLSNLSYPLVVIFVFLREVVKPTEPLKRLPGCPFKLKVSF